MRQPEPRCTTEQLLERWKSDRNPDDYWSLLEHLYPRLHHRIRTLYFRLGPRRHATSPTSLLDRTFLLLYQQPNKLEKHDSTPDSISEFIEAIAVREFQNIERLKHNQLRSLHGPGGSLTASAQGMVARSAAWDSTLVDIVDSLPTAVQQDVAVLFLDDKSEEEVAKLLGITVASVRATTDTIRLFLKNRDRRAE